MTIAGEEQAGQILNQGALGRVLITPERRDMLFGGVQPQRDEPNKVRAVRRDQIHNACLLA
jgi:hypothetical protein